MFPLPFLRTSFLFLISFFAFCRKGFIGAVTVVSVAGICCAFSPDYKLLLVFRSLVGFGLGGGHVFAEWFLEFIPAPNRGAWAFVLSSFWSFGSVVEASLAWVRLNLLVKEASFHLTLFSYHSCIRLFNLR